MDCSTPGLPVHHQLPELAQTHVNWVGDAIQPSHPLSAPSPHAFNLSQHQSLFQWVSSSHQVARVLEFQLQHQSFQWIFGVDFLPEMTWALFALILPLSTTRIVSQLLLAQWTHGIPGSRSPGVSSTPGPIKVRTWRRSPSRWHCSWDICVEEGSL